jgi:hypothetical protein
MRRWALVTFALLPCLSCIGTTGSEIVAFDAYATGTPEARGPFPNGQDWVITLTKAKVHIGAVYLNRAVPVSGGQERECFLPGVYVAQVTSGLDVDALSPALQPFPVRGSGTEDPAATGEVWLTGGRVDALDDRTIIADVAGAATRGVSSIRFEGTVTIGRNRATVSTDPARPGANPLCAERIVTPIPLAITPSDGGALVVRVDPRVFFANVDLGELEPETPTSDLRRFPDETTGQPATNLYRGLRAATGAYTFAFTSRVR